MKQHFIDEKTGIYTLQGDYYLPDLVLPAEEAKPIGVWGQRHRRYLKEHKRVTYTNFLTSRLQKCNRLDTYIYSFFLQPILIIVM